MSAQVLQRKENLKKLNDAKKEAKNCILEQARSFIVNGSDPETPKASGEKAKKRARDFSTAITKQPPLTGKGES